MHESTENSALSPQGPQANRRRGALGANIARLRDTAQMTQKGLAEKAGLSQSTISKLENSLTDDASLGDLGRISAALNTTLKELLSGTKLADVLGESGEYVFHAFCPNAMCPSNKVVWRNDAPGIIWKSWQSFLISEFAVVNFCERCGERLVKDCPSCGSFLRSPNGKWCVTCGARIHARPTDKEWDEINRAAQPGSDIPF